MGIHRHKDLDMANIFVSYSYQDNSAVVAISRRRFDGGTDAIEAEVVEVDPVVEAIINAAVDDDEDGDEE